MESHWDHQEFQGHFIQRVLSLFPAAFLDMPKSHAPGWPRAFLGDNTDLILLIRRCDSLGDILTDTVPCEAKTFQDRKCICSVFG